MNLCTSDGTPDQAYNAVHSLAKILNPKSDWGQTSCSNFASLFQKLTSTSKLRVEVESNKDSTLVTILSALSALTECCPLSFLSDRGDRAVKFALEYVLLGRNHEGEHSEDDVSLEDAATTSPRKKRKSISSAMKTSTPAKTGVLEDPYLSTTCRQLCASIQFLVSVVRFSRFAHEVNKKTAPVDRFEVQPDIISSLFQTLTQIIIDQGLPPSNKDRNFCKSRRERAALRQVSVISLLRLCDARVGLEKDYLTQTMWHLLGGAFLDEETSVREAILSEYSDMLSGSGAFGATTTRLSPRIPSLRFLSLLCLSGDGDHDNDPANGCAANIGVLVSTVQDAATRSIIGFRRSSEAYYARCKALGKESVQRFESGVKMSLMPENAIPYAYHLLTHRRETPSPSTGDRKNPSHDSDDEGSIDVSSPDIRFRLLQRRLRLLLDPLINSLGEHADNISYLIRMTETLGKNYGPIDVSLQYAGSSQPKHYSLRSPIDHSGDRNGLGKRERTSLLNERLATICSFARDVLVTYIKQDVNITPYPGQISFPNGLFRQSSAGTVVLKRTSHRPRSDEHRTPARSRSGTPRTSKQVPVGADSNDESHREPPQSTRKSPRTPFSPESKKPDLATPAKDADAFANKEKPSGSVVLGSGRASRVRFSPDPTPTSRIAMKSPHASPKDSVQYLTSPATLATSSSLAAATLGSTPPPSSIVPTSTALDDSDEDTPGGKSTSQSIASLSTAESRSTRSARRRKQPERYEPMREDMAEMPKKQKKSPSPNQIHLKKYSRGSLKDKKQMDADDLDFPSGVENRPKSRAKGKRGGRKQISKT